MPKLKLDKGDVAIIFRMNGACEAMLPNHQPDDEIAMDSPTACAAIVMTLFSDPFLQPQLTAIQERIEALARCHG